MFDNMVGKVIIIMAALIIIVFAIFIIKDVLEILKGQGSILKTVGKIVAVFVILGIIFASRNYVSFGEKFGQVAESAVDGIAEEAGELFE